MLAESTPRSIPGSPATNAPSLGDSPAGELVARLMAMKAPERPVLERARGGLLTVDANLSIIDADPEMLRLTGVSRRELVGSPLSAYVQVPEMAAEAIHQAFTRGSAAMFEIALRSSRGPAEAPDGESPRPPSARCIFTATLR